MYSVIIYDSLYDGPEKGRWYLRPFTQFELWLAFSPTWHGWRPCRRMRLLIVCR